MPKKEVKKEKKKEKTKETEAEAWLLPPRIKVLEALGTIGDRRIKVSRNSAKVTSSLGEKTYDVSWNGKDAIISNDNGSMYKGYLGYPSIALLMLKKILPFDAKKAEALRDIRWKELNERFKNYFKVEVIVKTVASRRGVKQNEIDEFILKVLAKIKELKIKKLGK